MYLFTQFLVVVLLISDTLQIRGYRPRPFQNDCRIASNALAPDLPENCHELIINNEDQISINKTERPLEVLTAEKLNKHPAALVTLKINGGLSGIERDCFFNHRDSLKNIEIVGNSIPSLSSYAFRGLSLKDLDLRNNEIVHLGMKPFEGSKIEDLNLNFNNISSLLKSTFAIELSKVRIAKNRVSFIESECFPGSLEVLDLRHNLLYDIERDHFRNLDNLKKLYLGNNHLINVDFTGNKLKKLEVLDLSFNQIVNINEDSFNTLTKLEILNLTNNNIRHISPTTLQIFGKLKVLDISLNRLSNFPYTDLPNSVEAFNNFGNPWNCACFFPMENYLAQNKISSFNLELDSTDLPFCVAYQEGCTDIPNESLITVFRRRMSPDLVKYCSLAGPIKHLKSDLLLSEPLVSAV